MKQIFITANRLPSASGTFYTPIIPGSAASTEEPKTIIFPVAGTLRNFKVQLAAAPGGAATRTITVRQNGSNTSLAVTFGSAETTKLDSTNSVSVSAGDRIVIQNSTSGTPALSDSSRYALEFEPSTDQRYILGGSEASPSTSANNFVNPLGVAGNGWGGSLLFKHQAVVPHSTSINAFYVRLTVAPGVGKSYRLSLLVNGVEDTSTRVTISDANTTGNVTGLSISLSAGDTVAVQCTPSGTPTATNPQWGILFTPGTNGESWVPIGHNSNLGTSTTEYLDTDSYQSNASTTESARQSIGGPTGFTLKNLRVSLGTAPGAAASGKSRTFTVRKNTANGSGTVTITETATSATDGSNSDTFAEGDLIALSSVSTSTPASSAVTAALVQFIDPGNTTTSTTTSTTTTSTSTSSTTSTSTTTTSTSTSSSTTTTSTSTSTTTTSTSTSSSTSTTTTSTSTSTSTTTTSTSTSTTTTSTSSSTSSSTTTTSTSTSTTTTSTSTSSSTSTTTTSTSTSTTTTSTSSSTSTTTTQSVTTSTTTSTTTTSTSTSTTTSTTTTSTSSSTSSSTTTTSTSSSTSTTTTSTSTSTSSSTTTTSTSTSTTTTSTSSTTITTTTSTSSSTSSSTSTSTTTSYQFVFSVEETDEFNFGVDSPWLN